MRSAHEPPIYALFVLVCVKVLDHLGKEVIDRASRIDKCDSDGCTSTLPATVYLAMAGADGLPPIARNRAGTLHMVTNLMLVISTGRCSSAVL